MAVENKYANSLTAAGKLCASIHSGKGADLKVFTQTFELAAADDNGSVYRLFKELDPELIPLKIELYSDAITGCTDVELGLYETSSDSANGPVIDLDILMGTLDISSGKSISSPGNGLGALDVANIGIKRLYEIAGHTQSTKKAGYDLALTANTVGSAAGTITVIMYAAQG